MARVQLENISKRYAKTEVISGLSLNIVESSFTVFVGPSGCGKSTLLRMIAGLEDITAGELRIGGERMNDADPIMRGVAMVFQNYALYPHMTVEQNIGFSLLMAGQPRNEIRRRVAEAASSLKIEPLMKRKPGQLSGGQRQRVAIGRAIVRDPRVFLFDEPLSNLDAELRVSMRVEIAKLHRRLGATMIYVTHDQTEAMTLADTIVVLREGKVEQTGSPEFLYERPVNTFVAGFIGSPRMNFLPAMLREGSITLDGVTLLRMPADDQEVIIGVRPEHFMLQTAPFSLEFVVDVVENLGGTRYLYGSIADGTQLVVEVRDGQAIRPNDRLPLRVRPECVHVFNKTGMRLA